MKDEIHFNWLEWVITFVIFSFILHFHLLHSHRSTPFHLIFGKWEKIKLEMERERQCAKRCEIDWCNECLEWNQLMNESSAQAIARHSTIHFMHFMHSVNLFHSRIASLHSFQFNCLRALAAAIKWRNWVKWKRWINSAIIYFAPNITFVPLNPFLLAS